MKIELRISPVHLYLVTPSDKSFLLWKWNLWCIIWFSLWKCPFILYDSCYSRGASAPFHFMVGSSSGRHESETLGSLWITHSRNQTSPKPIIYVDIWIYNFTHRESDYSSRTSGQPGIHRASAHYRRRLTQYRATAIALIKTQTNIIF